MTRTFLSVCELEVLRRILEQLAACRTALTLAALDFVETCVWAVNVRKLRDELLGYLVRAMDNLLEYLAEEAYLLAESAIETYNQHLIKMQSDPETIDELHELQTWIRKLAGVGGAQELRLRIQHIQGLLRILERHYVSPAVLSDLAYKLRSWPRRLEDEMQRRTLELTSLGREFSTMLEEEKSAFMEQLMACSEEVNHLKSFGCAPE